MTNTSTHIAIFFFAFIISNLPKAEGQTKEILISERIPNILIKNIENYSDTDIHINDLKGKAIILDFGGINCRGCVNQLPKMDSIQRRFKDKLIIFWVTSNTKKEIQEFCAQNKIGKTLSMPIIAQDTVLHNIFPRYVIPTMVWIDVFGNVLIKSSPEFVRPEFVEAFIKYRMGKMLY